MSLFSTNVTDPKPTQLPQGYEIIAPPPPPPPPQPGQLPNRFPTDVSDPRPSQLPGEKAIQKDVATAVALDDKREEKSKTKKEIKKEQEETEQFITKYRPEVFETVIGNNLAVETLKKHIKSKSHLHTYLFTGPTGVGKTTLARIVAKEFDASVFEINAAVNSGVEDTRALVDLTQFKPITGKPAILIIVDESQEMSSKAWSPFLKLAEEAPSYLYIAFCTTDPSKIPDTITKGRCFTTYLKQLKQGEIESLLTTVSEKEQWTIKNDVFNAIVQASEGSARNSLNLLFKGHDCKTLEELAELMSGIENENSPIFKLFNTLMRGEDNWKAVSGIIEKIEDFAAAENFLCNLLAKALTRSEGQQARQVGRMLCCFTNINAYNTKVHFYSAISRIMWSDIPF